MKNNYLSKTFILIFIFFQMSYGQKVMVGKKYSNLKGHMISPVALKNHSNDTYVLDHFLGKIVVYDKNYNLKKVYMGLKKATTFTVTDEYLYVSKSFDNKVIKINKKNGSQKILFGEGIRRNEFLFPGEIKFFDKKIYIIDELNNRIQIFDENEKYLDSILLPIRIKNGLNRHRLNYSMQIHNGKLYVLDGEAKLIYQFLGDKIEKRLNVSGVKLPEKLHLVDNKLFLFDRATGYFIGVLKKIKIETDFDYKITLSGFNDFYIKDKNLYYAENDGIYSYNLSSKVAKLLKKFNTVSKDEYIEPSDVKTFDNTLYILDKKIGKLIIYDRYGKFIRSITEIGISPESFDIDKKNGDIYISLPYENKIIKYDKFGEKLNELSGYKFLPMNERYYYEFELEKQPDRLTMIDRKIYNQNILVDSNNDRIFVINGKNLNVDIYDLNFKYIKSLGEKESILNIYLDNKSDSTIGWNEKNRDSIADIFHYDNKLYVLDKFYKRLLIIENNKIVNQTEIKSANNSLNSIYIDKKRIYIVDKYNYKIIMLKHDLTVDKTIDFINLGLMPIKIYGNLVIAREINSDAINDYFIINIEDYK